MRHIMGCERWQYGRLEFITGKKSRAGIFRRARSPDVKLEVQDFRTIKCEPGGNFDTRRTNSSFSKSRSSQQTAAVPSPNTRTMFLFIRASVDVDLVFDRIFVMANNENQFAFPTTHEG